MTSAAIVSLLTYCVLPLWFLAGVADWLCHRATDIEHTAGAKESVFHLVMFAEMAVPLLAVLFLQVNAAVFAIMIVAFLLHELTALWDVSFAMKWRRVTPIEQHVHSFLELIPFMAGLLVALLHWPQFLALFGLGSESADLSLRWKETPLPVGSIALILAAAALLELLPYAEELWRGLRARTSRLPRTGDANTE